MNTANIQDPNNPWDAPVQFGPTVDTDARHSINLSGSFTFPGRVRVSPVYYWRSALPVALVDGRDLNLDGDATEIPTTAYAVDTFDASKPLLSQATFKQIGSCTTVNCGRGMSQQQMNMRVSKMFHLTGRANVEAIGEVFNLFNSANPGAFRARPRPLLHGQSQADTEPLQPK